MRFNTNFIWFSDNKKIFYLLWNLSKVVDEPYDGIFLQRVCNAVDVDIALVEQVVKDVNCFYSCRSLLLGPEYQINPFMEVCTDIVTFQGLET